MARNKFDVDEELVTSFNLGYVKRILKYVKPYKKQMGAALIITLLASVVSLLAPYLIKVTLDNMIPNKNYRGIYWITVIYIATLIINGICLNKKIMIMSEVGQSVILNMRRDLFIHLQELPFTYYDSRPHGKILVRVVNYINGLSDLLSNGIINTITDMLSLFIIVGFMLAIDVRLTIICILGLPLLIGAAFLIKTAQRRAWQTMSSKLSNLNAYMHESISGIKVTQSFTREKENGRIFNNLNTAYKTSWLKTMSVQFLMGIFVDSISVLVIAFVYILGVTWMNQGAGITVGVLVAFMGYIGRFWGPIANLANTYNSVINAMAYLERIFETMDEKPVVHDLSGAVDMPEIKGKVEFKDVDFSYDDGKRILDNISFTAEEGESIAIVGPTGSGKTTIINLISRFYNLENGAILIDGIDIKNVTLKSLRKQMGVMLQDSFIFSGTIMENIRYGKLDATDEEVKVAARTVRAHDFIKTLSNEYETEVNERGSRLSAGQRQLISFARALLADPKVLILDEATSSIDTNTEILLQKGLQELLKGRTSFIIAHRLSTIKNADKIMYIDGGNIIECGNHDELMRKKGAYYKLYMSQYLFLDAV
jgi:ATP-binding cassette, subfamily B, multidrug efflux pump